MKGCSGSFGIGMFPLTSYLIFSIKLSTYAATVVAAVPIALIAPVILVIPVTSI